MPEPIVLFRLDGTNRDEYQACQEHFDVTRLRTVPVGRLVIGRYSVLPYYRDLEAELAYNDCVLINTYDQHHWVANFDYYAVLSAYTFPTWTDATFHRAPEGAYVVKGRTNSRKHHWDQLMFAANKADALRVASRLHEDLLVGTQGLLFRRYEPLKTFEVGINGLRFCNEWRVFYLDGRRVAHGYYWSEAQDIVAPRIDSNGMRLADEVGRICGEHCRFVAVDVAEKASGGWVLVEVNDGQMSGLCTIPAERFYANLSGAVKSCAARPISTGEPLPYPYLPRSDRP